MYIYTAWLRDIAFSLSLYVILLELRVSTSMDSINIFTFLMQRNSTNFTFFPIIFEMDIGFSMFDMCYMYIVISNDNDKISIMYLSNQ